MWADGSLQHKQSDYQVAQRLINEQHYSFSSIRLMLTVGRLTSRLTEGYYKPVSQDSCRFLSRLIIKLDRLAKVLVS